MLLCLLLSALRSCRDDLAEGLGIMNSKVRQAFAIKLDISLFHGVNQLAVFHAVDACGCVDSLDPKAPQLTPPLPAIAICVPKTSHHRFIGPLPKFAARAPLAFSKLDHLLVPSASDEPGFCSSHEISPCLNRPA